MDVEKFDLCKTSDKYTYFPDKYNLLDGSRLCETFGGQRVDVATQIKLNQVVTFLGNIKDDPAWSADLDITTYTMYTDDEQFNVWQNYKTGEAPEYPLPWNFLEPNGGSKENCAQLLVKKDENDNWVGRYNDEDCNAPAPVACQGIKNLRLILRGKDHW